MGKIKKYAWLTLRFCFLGPLAMCCIVSQWLADAFEVLAGWFEESFNNVSEWLGPSED